MATNEVERVWDLMEKISICMLTTWDGNNLHSRPMDARSRRAETAVYFLTDTRHHKDEEIERYPKLALAFADTGGQKYASVSGTAVVSNDRALIKELWEPTAKAWWDTADNPNIRVLKVTPTEAQYWDGPGTVVSMVKMMMAAATGTRPDLGANAKVTMTGAR
ncbi:MAG TPA: pyridoxamine 5'-phosphate oxidase family protein [Pseudolabrys sp.]|nr:pyridoxamine 5'-phosphate oxidase family protein [Pseudolabrys sp.]